MEEKKYSDAVFLWCNASWDMQALQEHLCEQDNSDNSASSVSFTQTEALIASTTVTINIDWQIGGFPL